jgi:hypothetical protein
VSQGIVKSLAHLERQTSVPIIYIQHHDVVLAGHVGATADEEKMADTLRWTREPGPPNRLTPLATSPVTADRHYDVSFFPFADLS